MKTYLVPQSFTRITIALLAIAGLAWIVSSALQWQAVHIQTLQGNLVPLALATIKVTGGMIYMMVAWFWLKVTRYQ